MQASIALPNSRPPVTCAWVLRLSCAGSTASSSDLQGQAKLAAHALPGECSDAWSLSEGASDFGSQQQTRTGSLRPRHVCSSSTLADTLDSEIEDMLRLEVSSSQAGPMLVLPGSWADSQPACRIAPNSGSSDAGSSSPLHTAVQPEAWQSEERRRRAPATQPAPEQ